MAKKMKSCRLDDELCAWSEGFAVQRGVSWASVVEAGLRDLQASAMGGVPDLGEEEPKKEPARVTVLARAPKPVRVDTVPAARSWAWERQQRLNRAKGL